MGRGRPREFPTWGYTSSLACPPERGFSRASPALRMVKLEVILPVSSREAKHTQKRGEARNRQRKRGFECFKGCTASTTQQLHIQFLSLFHYLLHLRLRRWRENAGKRIRERTQIFRSTSLATLLWGKLSGKNHTFLKSEKKEGNPSAS